MNEEFLERMWGIVSQEFSRVEVELRKVNPRLKWVAGHWQPGSVYPLSAYASAGLSRPTEDSEDVDLTLQVAWDGDPLTVSNDICFSDGRYIAEGTATRERDSDDREEWLTEQVQAASALFASNLDTLRYLVRPSGPGSGGSGITAHPLE